MTSMTCAGSKSLKGSTNVTRTNILEGKMPSGKKLLWGTHNMFSTGASWRCRNLIQMSLVFRSPGETLP
jgi:hypothetical protein